MPLIPNYDFISFEFHNERLGPEGWMMMGEAFSKCQHLAGVPLKPSAAANLSSVFFARGVAATTAIEGNTLSADEVKDIVDHGSASVPESREYLEREVKNVVKAILGIDDALKRGERLPITRERLMHLNFEILEGIPDRPEVFPGKLREHDVVVGTYKPPHYTDVPGLVDEFVKWLKTILPQPGIDTRPEERFMAAFCSAVLAHVYIAWIHPFGNGNGRLARLIEVQILSESGVVPLVATNLLSDHYNKTRDAYYRALDEARVDIYKFVRYALRGFLDELRAQIMVVRDENIKIHWESYVHERFKSMPRTAARDRQREVALTAGKGEVVTPESLTRMSVSLAKLYAVCGERTPARDLNALVGLDLFKKVGRREFVAHREVIEAFIPPTAHV